MTTDGSDMSPEAGDELVDALAQLSFVVQLVLTDVANDHDLSLTQLRLLAILRDHTPAMAELATHLGLDRSSATGLVDRAEKRSLVRREPRPGDGRGVQVCLTEDGGTLVEQARGPIAARLHALTETLTDTERSVLTMLAGKILTVTSRP